MATIPRSSISTASVNWLDSGGTIHIRVYSSDGNNVTERCWDGNGWSDGSFKAPGEAVSATAWQGKGGLSIRVYCTLQDNTTEWCIDQGGGWYKGAYTLG
jgi:hypothetical protein